MPPKTSGLETEWDYSSRKGRDGQKKKTGKANERKRKVKGGKDEEVNGQGGEWVPQPHMGLPQPIISFISASVPGTQEGHFLSVPQLVSR